jgi:hypothetical protein
MTEKPIALSSPAWFCRRACFSSLMTPDGEGRGPRGYCLILTPTRAVAVDALKT